MTAKFVSNACPVVSPNGSCGRNYIIHVLCYLPGPRQRDAQESEQGPVGVRMLPFGAPSRITRGGTETLCLSLEESRPVCFPEEEGGEELRYGAEEHNGEEAPPPSGVLGDVAADCV